MKLTLAKYLIHLAPMEGVSDFPFRLWLSLVHSPKEMSTPFLRVTETYPHRDIPLAWAPECIDKDVRTGVSYNLIPQLMAADVERFCEVAQRILAFSEIVELNCGCPAPTVVGKGAGSQLLSQPAQFRRFLEVIDRSLGVSQVSLKTRLGFECRTEFDDLLEIVSPFRFRRYTLHARTRAERYGGFADWRAIAKASQKLSIPVFGSGDIRDLATLRERLLKAPEVTGVLIGRGAVRNPWIFAEIESKEPFRLDLEVLLTSLRVYGLINEMFIRDFDTLLEHIREGEFKKSCKGDLHSWQRIEYVLAPSLFGQVSNDYPLHRNTLNRCKLVWSYLRSSLPEPCFEPKILRNKTFHSLESHIRSICHQNNLNSWPLIHKQNHDWLYGTGRRGGKKKKKN